MSSNEFQRVALSNTTFNTGRFIIRCASANLSCSFGERFMSRTHFDAYLITST